MTTTTNEEEVQLVGFTCPTCNYILTRVDDPAGELFLNPDNYNVPVVCPNCEETRKLNHWKLRLKRKNVDHR